MSIRDTFNPKRKFRETMPGEDDRESLSEDVEYTGSPYHKRDPGDFDLTPPSAPRPNKTLCDQADIFEKEMAQSLLEEGVQRGMISEQQRGGYPQNIWSVTDDGIPVEAQLENQAQGTYHGYPLTESDPFSKKVLQNWEER